MSTTEINLEVNEVSPTKLYAAEAFYERALAALRTVQTKLILRFPYQDYTNYSTYCICAMFEPHPHLYARLITRLERFDKITPVTARLIGGVLLARYIPDPEAEWNQVDWKNVAAVWNEALKEHRSYI